MKGLLVKALLCSQHNADEEQPEEGGDKYGGYLHHRTVRRKQRLTGTVKRVVVDVSGEVSIHHEREAHAMLMRE